MIPAKYVKYVFLLFIISSKTLISMNPPFANPNDNMNPPFANPMDMNPPFADPMDMNPPFANPMDDMNPPFGSKNDKKKKKSMNPPFGRQSGKKKNNFLRPSPEDAMVLQAIKSMSSRKSSPRKNQPTGIFFMHNPRGNRSPKHKKGSRRISCDFLRNTSPINSPESNPQSRRSRSFDLAVCE